MSFVRIPAGEYLRGTPNGSPYAQADELQQTVVISKDFYLQTTEVTQKQWVTLMQGNPSSFRQCGETCPVDRINPQWIPFFIEKLNALEPSITYRLPTEVEWEYAAKASTVTAFSTGDCLAESQANVNGQHSMESCEQFSASLAPKPVASYPPNAWGLYDMHGNVWEICQDWYGPYPATDQHTRLVDPTGPSTGKYKVLRGGSWRFPIEFARSANRFKAIKPIGGFRLIRESRAHKVDTRQNHAANTE